MATVYLAEDLKHHRQVAIKVLRPELAPSLGVERFVREIEIAANLTHPHILPLFDSGEADGFLYYVMPFIKGRITQRTDGPRGETRHQGSDSPYRSDQYGIVAKPMRVALPRALEAHRGRALPSPASRR